MTDVGLQPFLEALHQGIQDQVLPLVTFNHLQPLISMYENFELMDVENTKMRHLRRNVSLDLAGDTPKMDPTGQKAIRALQLVTEVFYELDEAEEFEKTGRVVVPDGDPELARDKFDDEEFRKTRRRTLRKPVADMAFRIINDFLETLG